MLPMPFLPIPCWADHCTLRGKWGGGGEVTGGGEEAYGQEWQNGRISLHSTGVLASESATTRQFSETEQGLGFQISRRSTCSALKESDLTCHLS